MDYEVNRRAIGGVRLVMENYKCDSVPERRPFLTDQVEYFLIDKREEQVSTFVDAEIFNKMYLSYGFREKMVVDETQKDIFIKHYGEDVPPGCVKK